MTDLRTAAQQALEALEDDQYRLVEVSPNQYEYKTDLAIAALERALAQQAEPVAWADALKDAFFEGFTSVATYNDTLLNSPEEAWANYKLPHIALAQQAEPVAWSGYDLDGMVEAFSRVIEAHHSSKHPFHNPIDMDARMALRILRGFIPAMKAYAALAQQAEPKPMSPEQRQRWEELAALAQQAEPVEQMPVGWLESPHGAFRADPLYKMQFPSQLLQWQIALYTAPPQRKPLTQEQLYALYDEHATHQEEGPAMSGWFDFARAVERAHGITDPQIADRLARHGIPMPGDTDGR